LRAPYRVPLLALLCLGASLTGCGGSGSWSPVNVARLRVGYDPPRALPRCRVPVRVLYRPGDEPASIAAYGDYPLTVHRIPAFLTRHLPWALSFYFPDVEVVSSPPKGTGHLLVRAKIHSLGTTKRVIGTGASWGVTSRKYRAAISWRVTVEWVGSGLPTFTHDQRVYGTVDAFRFGASPDIVRSALRQALQELLADLLQHRIYQRACARGSRPLPPRLTRGTRGAGHKPPAPAHGPPPSKAQPPDKAPPSGKAPRSDGR
jgi:hypothetical protein